MSEQPNRINSERDETLQVDPSVEVQGLIGRTLGPVVAGRERRNIDSDRAETTAGADQPLALVNPSTAETFCRVETAGIDEVDQSVMLALDVIQGEWGAYSASERECLLYRFAELVDSYPLPLAELEALGTGRPCSSVLHDVVPEAVRWVRYLAGLPTKMDGHTSADQGALEPFRCSFREPAGIAVVRLHAGQSLTRRLIPLVSALAAGCPLIMLCDDGAYPGLHYLCALMVRAGIPAEALSLLAGDSTLESTLLDHEGVFVPQLPGDQPGDEPGQLRSSRMMVFEDADIDQVVDTLLTRVLTPLNPAAFTPRLHVHQRIFDELIEAVEGRLGRLAVGPVLNASTRVGAIHSTELLRQAQDIVACSRDHGLRVICGGSGFGPGYGFLPTLIADDQLRMAHLPLSIPAPLLMVQPYGSEEKTLRRANHDRYCQGISLFTQQLPRIRRLSRALRSEQVWVNSHYRMEPGDAYDPLAPYLRRRTLWVDS